MSIPDEAVEAAYAHLGPDNTGFRYVNKARLRGLLEAAAPFIAAQATALIADLLDPDPCSFDHNHSCQAHGYYYLKQDEACPQHDAKEWVKAYLRSGT